MKTKLIAALVIGMSISLTLSAQEEKQEKKGYAFTVEKKTSVYQLSNRRIERGHAGVSPLHLLLNRSFSG